MASIRSGIGGNMEDRYLFKAKRLDNGEWVTGSLITCEDGTYKIATSYLDGDTNIAILICAYEVDRDTICQCTGLKDKNGKLIWENDVAKDEHDNFYKAFWQNNYYQFSWACVKSDVFLIGAEWSLLGFKSFEIEVVGNIFDNPELLESEVD